MKFISYSIFVQLSLILSFGSFLAKSFDPNDTYVLGEAEFAIAELSQLSDSTIYTTLKLLKILDAKTQSGIFHNNTILEVQLSSPYFKSGKSEETYHIIVMTHKEDGIKSFAIDEFPIMKDDAIEEFYIKKVERKRMKREEAFRRLEIESSQRKSCANYQQQTGENDNNSNLSVQELLGKIERDGLRQDTQSGNSENFRAQLSEEQLSTDEALSKLSLAELYNILISIDNEESADSDFQKYRAQELLNGYLDL
jgi:hypothetical protein